MKATKTIANRLYMLVMLMFLFLPGVWVLLRVPSIAEMWPGILCLFTFVSLTLLGSLLPRWLQYPGTALGLGLAFFLMRNTISPAWFLFFFLALGIVVFFFTFKPETIESIVLLSISLILYGIVLYTNKSVTPSFNFLLMVMASSLIIHALYHANTSSLYYRANKDDAALPKDLRKANMKFILPVFVVIIVCANLTFLRTVVLRGIGRILVYITTPIFWLFSHPAPASTPDLNATATPTLDPLDADILGESSTPLMIRIALMILLSLAFIVISIALFILIRKIIRWVKENKQRTRTFTHGKYTDKTESLFSLSAFFQRRSRKRTVKQPKRKWETLSPREQVRYGYQVWLSKVSSWNPTLQKKTARQALTTPSNHIYNPDDRSKMADAYDAARYSDHEVSPDHVDITKRVMNENPDDRKSTLEK